MIKDKRYDEEVILHSINNETYKKKRNKLLESTSNILADYTA